MSRKKLPNPSHCTFARIPFNTHRALVVKARELNTTVSKLIVLAVQKFLGITE